MTTEAEELQRKISASVRDMLDAFRIQAQAGPVTACANTAGRRGPSPILREEKWGWNAQSLYACWPQCWQS